MILDAADLEALVAEANLAPSVHNTQPTRWRRLSDTAVLVLEDASRRLPVGDPLGRDAAVSHGAAIEGFALAAGARGWSIAVAPENADDGEGLRSVARLTLTAGGVLDPLHAFVASRRTYRGRFTDTPPPSNLDPLQNEDDAIVVSDPGGIADLARLNDAGSLSTFRDGGFRAELLSWMRLARSHPRWALDGLNSEAMAMSPLEAVGAGVVLKPGVFEALDRVGLAAPLTAEAAVVRSSAAVVLFHRPDDESPLDTGRRFYRRWLAFTQLGLAAAPMAVLADDPGLRAAIVSRFSLPPGRRLITAFRVGVAPPAPSSDKPRLPLAQLLA